MNLLCSKEFTSLPWTLREHTHSQNKSLIEDTNVSIAPNICCESHISITYINLFFFLRQTLIKACAVENYCILLTQCCFYITNILVINPEGKHCGNQWKCTPLLMIPHLGFLVTTLSLRMHLTATWHLEMRGSFQQHYILYKYIVLNWFTGMNEYLHCFTTKINRPCSIKSSPGCTVSLTTTKENLLGAKFSYTHISQYNTKPIWSWCCASTFEGVRVHTVAHRRLTTFNSDGWQMEQSWEGSGTNWSKQSNLGLKHTTARYNILSLGCPWKQMKDADPCWTWTCL